MKLLIFHVREFWFRTHARNLDTEEEREEQGSLEGGGVLAWVQVESGDLERRDEVIRVGRCVRQTTPRGRVGGGERNPEIDTRVWHHGDSRSLGTMEAVLMGSRISTSIMRPCLHTEHRG